MKNSIIDELNIIYDFEYYYVWLKYRPNID